MIFRTSFLVVASVAVFIITRSKINCPMSRKTPSTIFFERNDSSFKQEQEEEVVQGLGSKAIDEPERNESEENEWISEFQLHNKDWNCVIEIEKLKNVAEKMEKRRKSLEMKLLELYCLRQQQLNIGQLRKDLKLKIVEIDMLNATINSLRTEKIRLGEEIKQNELAEKQLENARRMLVEMQNKKCVESAQMKGQLMMVKEQISGFRMEAKDDIMGDKFEEKIRAMKNVELEGVELKRGNKELQLEMRELTVKLFATQTRITALSEMTESKIIGKAKDEIRSLTRSNDVLLEQVEQLQKNKFSMVEELVYQRWLNACLRSEINVYNTPPKQQLNPKFSKKLSFESQESANTSSSVESDETSNTTITSYSSSQESIKKKRTLVQNIKKWGRRKDDDSIQKGLIRRYSMSNVPKKQAINVANNEQFTSTFNSRPSGLKQKNQVFGFSESPTTRRLRRVSFTDTIKSMDEKSDNEQISNTFYSSASELILEGKQKVTLSGGLRKTDNGNNDEIENQVINKKGAVDSLSERKVWDQLMDFVAAAVVFFFFILLIYLFLASIIH